MKPLQFAAALAVAVFLAADLSSGEDAIAARINGVPITVTEMKRTAAPVPADIKDADALRQQSELTALRSLVDLELLVQDAKRKKIVVSPEEVESQIMEVKAQFASPQAFEQALAGGHATEADLRRDIERQLTGKKLLESEVLVELPPGVVEQYYASHIDDYKHPELVRPSHILFRTPPDRDRKEVKKRAEQTLKRIRAGEDFDKVAQEAAQDPNSILNNGDLGYIRRDEMAKRFTDAAFKLKPGEISNVVETDFGFHIIRLIDRRPAGVFPLAEVRPQIETLLKEQETAKRSDEYMQKLRDAAKIEILAAPKP